MRTPQFLPLLAAAAAAGFAGWVVLLTTTEGPATAIAAVALLCAATVKGHSWWSSRHNDRPVASRVDAGLTSEEGWWR
ncbi:hypothetical protein [Nonomuraea typhae]|uniref:hypothetical protein n=1 Tax=Nonomuraea typhae TaxID=2603600 RepID=UPI0012FC9DBC|nr:hypothetical protein [Nonomuraea typhae]